MRSDLFLHLVSLGFLSTFSGIRINDVREDVFLAFGRHHPDSQSESVDSVRIFGPLSFSGNEWMVGKVFAHGTGKHDGLGLCTCN